MNLNSMNISSSVRLPFPLSARSSIHRPLRLSFPLCVPPLIRSSGFLSILPSFCPFFYPSVRPSVCSLVCPFNSPSVCQFVRPFFYPSVRPLLRPFVGSSVRFFDHKLSFPSGELSGERRRRNAVWFSLNPVSLKRDEHEYSLNNIRTSSGDKAMRISKKFIKNKML